MSMIDIPDNLLVFERQFSTEEKCFSCLFNIKYPEGFICSACGSTTFWQTGKELLHCRNCGKQTSLRTGTIMEGSKKPLMLWFRALFLAAFQKGGINAKELRIQLGLGSYQTAWTWLQKIRKAISENKILPLEGIVEVDETLLGGKSLSKMALIAVGVEKGKQNKIGRISMELLPNASAHMLSDFIRRNIRKGAVIRTDGWNKITDPDYKHIIVKKRFEENLLPGVNLVVSLFKTWTDGLHHGFVQEKHLPGYLDEFSFRFNLRRAQSRGEIFYNLIQSAFSVKPPSYIEIINGKKH